MLDEATQLGKMNERCTICGTHLDEVGERTVWKHHREPLDQTRCEGEQDWQRPVDAAADTWRQRQ